MSKSFVCCLAIIAASMALVWAAVAVAGKPTKGGRLQPQRRARQAGPDFKGAPPGGEHARGVAVQKMRSRIYQGTRIEPMPDANGAALALQQQIAVLLAQLDPMPKQRLEYYAWLHEMPVWISGWQGSIKAITPVADGWRVRVSINPLLSSDVGTAAASDSIDEIYEYSAGRLHFVQGRYGPRAFPPVLTFN